MHWVLIYDGACGFCKWTAALLLDWDRAGRLRPLALGTPEADALLHELTPAERAASFHLVSPAGERRSGGEALPAVLDLLPAGFIPARALAALPGLTDRGYRWVATNRIAISRWVPSRAKRRASERVKQREDELSAR